MISKPKKFLRMAFHSLFFLNKQQQKKTLIEGKKKKRNKLEDPTHSISWGKREEAHNFNG